MRPTCLCGGAEICFYGVATSCYDCHLDPGVLTLMSAMKDMPSVEFDCCASQFIFILLNSMPGFHAFTFRLLPYCYLCTIDLFQEHFPLLFTTENNKNAFQ